MRFCQRYKAHLNQKFTEFVSGPRLMVVVFGVQCSARPIDGKGIVDVDRSSLYCDSVNYSPAAMRYQRQKVEK